MQEWRIHWLEAEDSLSPWKEPILSGLNAAKAALSSRLSPPRLDILVQPGHNVIPEIGLVGFAYRKSLFSLTLDPENPNLPTSLHDGTLARQAAHEVHHCLRMAGPGYGRTLGEALVSEGLAGQFTRELFDSAPEPWEKAVSKEVLDRHFPDDATLNSTDYNHASWFFGSGEKRPRWLGYTLGYEIVGEWLKQAGQLDSSTWIEVPSETVLSFAKEGYSNSQ